MRHAGAPGDDGSLLEASLAELERQRAAVLQLNQLKNDLIAVLAHDIKGPLTSIVGFAELLEEGYLEGEAATDAARTIRSNAQRLAALANDVLALSRIEHGELEIADDPVDLVLSIEHSVQSLDESRDIRFTPHVSKAIVRGDADRLGQVFDNLLRNAVKYSPKSEPIDITLRREGDDFVVDVRDRGIGIPQEDLPKLFARFSRGSNARRAKTAGTGLGLFIVKMIVDRHGGSINVESSVGEGSTFSLSLPSIDAPAGRRPIHVIVVAVDAHTRLFVAYELRSHGYRVRECASIADIGTIGEVRDGDVVILGSHAGSEVDLRAALPAGVRVRLVCVDRLGSDCDAVLRRPFLTADLLSAVSGEPRDAFLSTGEDTFGAPMDAPRGDSVRIP